MILYGDGAVKYSWCRILFNAFPSPTPTPTPTPANSYAHTPLCPCRHRLQVPSPSVSASASALLLLLLLATLMHHHTLLLKRSSRRFTINPPQINRQSPTPVPIVAHSIPLSPNSRLASPPPLLLTHYIDCRLHSWCCRSEKS